MRVCLQVETAGDCYIVCAGLLHEDEQGFRTLDPQSDQAASRTRAGRRVLNFAVEMMHVARTVMMPHNGQPVEQRVGIHSGPIVSGLIGQLLPKFALLCVLYHSALRIAAPCMQQHWAHTAELCFVCQCVPSQLPYPLYVCVCVCVSLAVETPW